MRIFGGHDYYDSAMGYGQDPELVFERARFEKAKTIEAASSALLKEATGIAIEGEYVGRAPGIFRRKDVDISIEPVVVWFAGRRYGGFNVYRRYWASHQEAKEEFFWSERAFRAFLAEHEIGIRKRSYVGSDLTSERLGEFFCREPKMQEVDWLIENRISIAVLQNRHWYDDGNYMNDAMWIVNCDGLSNLQFAKCLDPYSAFQELAMWIGGVLPRREVSTVTITGEKMKLQQHGFDQWSFKKMPNSS